MSTRITVRVYIASYREDDPLKNTALRMARRGYAKLVDPRRFKEKTLVLNPFSSIYLGSWHRQTMLEHGILVVDASWRTLTPLKFTGFRGLHVKLPPLLPGNPVNYGKPCTLSSLEAVAASLYITGFTEDYVKLLGLYKWMETFHELNKELLDAYSKAGSPGELESIILEYWPTGSPC
ncbi:MAG: DUF367 family protein [Desulfurococcus sp.]|nr:DUF367 family protein [Desulfurococcus sp.]